MKKSYSHPVFSSFSAWLVPDIESHTMVALADFPALQLCYLLGWVTTQMKVACLELYHIVLTVIAAI